MSCVVHHRTTIDRWKGINIRISTTELRVLITDMSIGSFPGYAMGTQEVKTWYKTVDRGLSKETVVRIP